MDRPVPPENAPAAYRQKVQNASRLSVNFRFRLGSSRLDNKSLRDIGRIADTLAIRGNKGRRILLFGFSDNTGTVEANQTLSRERVEA
jgi:phosphate transport system substrate-binding protein